MLQRQTQTPAFWRDRFNVSHEDVDFLYNIFIDDQSAKTLDALAVSLIDEYVRRETVTIQSELAKGDVYVPNAGYEVGQNVVFPALDFAVGTVQEVRLGQNPEHGDFEVMQVEFAEMEQSREFAMNLKSSHSLSQTDNSGPVDGDSLLSSQEIFQLCEEDIRTKLTQTLQSGERSREFVAVDEQWLLADMLAEVNVGHLNIAEALIDMQEKPMATEIFFDELSLDPNVSSAMRAVSLNHAFNHDARFDQVNVQGEPHWYLKRLEPDEVINPPSLLQYSATSYNRALLSVELLQLEWELDDEWGESSLNSEVPTVVPSTTMTLTYPHRRYGTLPLSGRTRSFFPDSDQERSLVTIVDGRWGNRYQCWVTHEQRYVHGLGKWMEDHEIPVGALLTLERSADEKELVLDFRTRRAKREWGRIATADVANRMLTFEMNKIMIACEYDEYMVVADHASEPIDELREILHKEQAGLMDVVEQITPELIKLNAEGTVHAKSVYSATNILYRATPGEVFYALISNRRFNDMGDGLFSLA